MLRQPYILVLVTFVSLTSCGDKEDTAMHYEGDDPGECSDDADNDRDGLFDCDDPDCSGAAACQEADADTDTDADGDTDSDADGDADGDTDTGMVSDQDGDGYISTDHGGDDCDDDDASIHPGAEDTWGDGIDQDCDGLADTTYLTNADAIFLGEAENDNAGRSVSAAGDVNGDGYSDLLIGAYTESSISKYSGAAYIVHGPVTGEMSLASADAKLLGENERSVAGFNLTGLGDMNADGFDDFVVGAMLASSAFGDAPVAYLVHGPVSGEQSLGDSDTKIIGAEGACSFTGLAAAGDMDQDGFQDMLVGTSCESADGDLIGAAYVLHGPVTDVISTGDVATKITAESSGDYGGSRVSGGADVDGDGVFDVVVGAFFDATGGHEAGAAYLVTGPVGSVLSLVDADAKIAGDYGSWTGYSVAMAGDLDADGHTDVLIGSPQGELMLGAVYVFYGPLEGDHAVADADATYTGENTSDMAGASVAAAGDMNADGFDDVVVGAYGEGDGGSAYLVYGPATGHQSLVSAAARLDGDSGMAGWDVAGAGDTNGDGLPDLIIGALHASYGTYQNGAAYLVLGR